MQVSVTFRHMDTSDALRDYSVEKVQRIIAKYLKNAVEAHVVLDANRNRAHTSAEINIHASHFDIAAHADNTDIYAAVDATLDKVEAQLRRHKDRINDRRGRPSASDVATLISVDVVSQHDDEGATNIVETETLHAKELTVNEAVMQLELRHAEVLVFRNCDTNAISVLYRRRDGHYGLIVPTA